MSAMPTVSAAEKAASTVHSEGHAPLRNYVGGRWVESRASESLDVFNPHPEVSWRTLFGKVWYEGYDHPAYVWQSSGASDDVEPKLSLTPLLSDTLAWRLPAFVFAGLLSYWLCILGSARSPAAGILAPLLFWCAERSGTWL